MCLCTSNDKERVTNMIKTKYCHFRSLSRDAGIQCRFSLQQHFRHPSQSITCVSNCSMSMFLQFVMLLTSKLWATLQHKLLSELLNPVQVFLALLQQQFRNQDVKACRRLTSREGSCYTRMTNISYCVPGHEANQLLNTGNTLNTTWLEKILFSNANSNRFCKTLKSIVTCSLLHLLQGKGKNEEHFKPCPSYFCFLKPF